MQETLEVAFIFVYHSPFNCGIYSFTEIRGNMARNSGRGIHAITSQITAYCDRGHPFHGEEALVPLHFTKNVANKGGGICLESVVQLRMQKIGETSMETPENCTCTGMNFTSNTADYGGSSVCC